ncbi:MAG: nucleotidyltransferase family protein [Oscillospiraceae bacterium]|nr:nucleotidyltransferase family protein [Oscillospiraceae bacterium]
MKAFLLAAGIGSRLRPLTDATPKCLIPVAGKPLIEWWLELFRLHGVTDVLINTHHHREQVRDFIDGHNANRGQPKLYETYEQRLMGSCGTVLTNRDFVAEEREFLICYADNLTRINLTALRDFHRGHNGVLTMALSPSNTPEQAGIVSLDENGLIVEFVEKPVRPKSDLANAGVYIANQAVFSHFPRQEFIDFAADVLQGLAGQMYGRIVEEYHLDIGTPENLQKARDEWLT